MQELSDKVVFILGASIFLLMNTVFVVLLVFAFRKRDVVYLAEKQRMKDEYDSQILKSQIEMQEQTFQHISKELHDNVGQLLSTSRMLIGLTERELKQHAPDTLQTANATIGKAISEIRALSRSLDKDWISKNSLQENLENEVARLRSSTAIEIDFDKMPEIRLTGQQQIVVFRIIQESIQNAIKHASCKKIVLRLSSANNKLTTIINDDGIGFNIETITNGLGLMNMRHRTTILGGSIRWLPQKPNGTIVQIIIPENDLD